MVVLLVLTIAAGCGGGPPEQPEVGSGLHLSVPASPSRPDAGPALLPGSAAGFNLLLVTMDTTRADHLGCYGHGRAATPNLDDLAAAGVRFARAYSPVPMTLPAHATIFTGLDPPGHGVRANGEFRLAETSTTLAEILAGQGWETAAFVSSFVVDARFGLDQGFGVFDFTAEPGAASHAGGHPERSARAVTEAALAWLDRRSPDRPFFLWVHFFDPHIPYAPPAAFARRFPDDPYLAEVAAMDGEIGRLLSGLGRGGAASRTLVVAVGDHGESRGEHDELHHSRTLYEGAVRVPFLVASPGVVAPGRVVDGTVVSLVDVLPTVLDLLGLAALPAGTADGRSLCGTLPDATRIVYLETLGTYLASGWAPLFAACRVHDKLIRAPRPEYFDLERDPAEAANLWPSGGAVVEPPSAASLSRFLDDYLADKPSAGEVAAGVTAMDADTRAQLAALGYLTEDRVASPLDQAPDPKDMLPLYHLYLAAQQALAQGQAAQAESIARSLLARAPRDRGALRLLGEACLRQDRYREAEEALRARAEIRPDAVGLALLANAVMLQDRFAEAAEILDRAAGLEPDNGVVLFARGDLALLAGRPAEAIAFYQESAAVDPNRFQDAGAERVRRVRQLAGAAPPPAGRGGR